MKRIFIALSILLFGVRCSTGPNLPEFPEGFSYTIYEDKLDKGLSRRIVRIKINQEIKEPTIKKLSDWVRDNRTDAKEVIIFYIREDKEYVGAWARVDYLPDYKLDLIAIEKQS